MKVFLLSLDKRMTDAWEKYFCDKNDVFVVCKDFFEFMKNTEIDCVVSPANSFGKMDGGYDAAITAWFGKKLQQDVQQYILDNFFGEQPVGSSFIIDTPIEGVKLIHTPTMRIPERIIDDAIIYHCMRTCLMTALQNNVQAIVIPAFGATTGKVPRDRVAELMLMAYEQITSPIKKMTWKNAIATHYR